MEQSVLSRAIDQLYDEGPEAHGDCGSMEALLRQKARMDAFVSESVAAFDAGGEWAESGAFSATAWMKHACRLSGSEAGRLRKWGKALCHLPAVEEAFSAGAITSDHVSLLVSLDHGTTKEAFRRDEQMLVDLARTLTFQRFKDEIDAWRLRVDPDGTTEAAEEKKNRSDAWLVEGFDGMWLGRLVLDPVLGPIVSNEFERLVELLYRADRREARERLGRDPRTDELCRTPNQRRVAAFAWMAQRSASTPQGAQRPAPLFTVHTGADTIQSALAEMEGGSVVPMSQLLPWLDDADIVRVRHDPGGPLTLSYAMRLREVTIRCLEETLEGAKDRKECNPTDRTFTGATRRAIEIRDRQCSHPYCDRPARYCQIDHIKPYSQGGLTTQANGRLLCPRHNRWCFEHEQRFGLTGQPTDERNPPRRE